MILARNLILSAALVLMAVGGYLLMVRLDRSLITNKDHIESENQKTAPDAVIISPKLSPEEITARILTFCETHDDPRILLYDASLEAVNDKVENHLHR